jgi:hypothetical protein
MGSAAGQPMPAFIDRAQSQLADYVLRKLWARETNNDERKSLASTFYKPGYKLYRERPPIVGVGVGESENGVARIEFLTTVPFEAFLIPNLLQSLQLQSVAFHVTRTERIRACARPAKGGDSIGYANGLTGTVGALVQNSARGKFLLSCNHVIADVNRGKKNVDAIWQPGKKDGGTAKDKIGTLRDFKTLNLGGSASNDIDAALCAPDDPGDVAPGIRAFGAIAGVNANPALRTTVRKEGRTTGVTSGKLRIKNLSMLVRYHDGSDALFDNQLGIIGTSTATNFAEQGDSGAIVLDDSGEAIGLLIADSDGVDVSFANPIEPVLAYFGVTLC